MGSLAMPVCSGLALPVCPILGHFGASLLGGLGTLWNLWGGRILLAPHKPAIFLLHLIFANQG